MSNEGDAGRSLTGEEREEAPAVGEAAPEPAAPAGRRGP